MNILNKPDDRPRSMDCLTKSELGTLSFSGLRLVHTSTDPRGIEPCYFSVNIAVRVNDTFSQFRVRIVHNIDTDTTLWFFLIKILH